ncbi:permease-like cell division protein FtsX [Dentiradicibacter hellwigii]|uniref:Cell division protein FtsX n=1 Tax=Dentiradicibacter hellwigii TaxID=3149053 RepID=A0ABV4UDJ1_9RHOO
MRRFFAQHLAALRDAWRRLVSTPLNSLLSLIVIGAALTLPSVGWVVLDNLRGVGDYSAGIPQISLFMTRDAEPADVAEIESRLREAKAGNWRFVSREEALKRMASNEGMAEIVANLPRNPLPDAFIVEPDDLHLEAQEALVTRFSAWPKVAHVQIDSDWARRLDAFLRLGKLSLTLLAGLFGGALVVVTFNTIRLQILAQSDEIEVAKLIGATDAFIRRPFYYFGALQGALGGLFAAALVWLGVYLLTPVIHEIVALYHGHFVLSGPAARQVAVLAGVGAALGWIGAWLSAAIHLHKIG